MDNSINRNIGRLLQVAIFMLLLTIALPVKSTPTVSKQYQIMSSILLQLSSFTVWNNSQSYFVTICLFGVDPFGQYIDDMLKRLPKNRAGQFLKIKRLPAEQPPLIEECNILYTAPNSVASMWKLLPSNHHILLVSQDPEFINQGGMVNFVYQDKRVKLEVNLPAVQHAGLTMSSVLLKHAYVIKGQPRHRID